MSKPSEVERREQIAKALFDVWVRHNRGTWSRAEREDAWAHERKRYVGMWEQADAVLALDATPDPADEEPTTLYVPVYNPKTWKPINPSPAPPADVEAALLVLEQAADERETAKERIHARAAHRLIAERLATVTSLVAAERERCLALVESDMSAQAVAAAIRQEPRP